MDTKKKGLTMKETQSTLALLEVQEEPPKDLMSLKEICLKHSIDYDYLYKWSVLKGEIKVHFRGVWKVSEKEVFEFIYSQEVKKLSKIRAGKGGE